jgi:hypothetical protein
MYDANHIYVTALCLGTCLALQLYDLKVIHHFTIQNTIGRTSYVVQCCPQQTHYHFMVHICIDGSMFSTASPFSWFIISQRLYYFKNQTCCSCCNCVLQNLSCTIQPRLILFQKMLSLFLKSRDWLHFTKSQHIAPATHMLRHLHDFYVNVSFQQLEVYDTCSFLPSFC